MPVTFTYGTQFQVDANGGLARVAPLTSSTAIALYSSAASGIEARHLTNSGGILTGGTVLTIDANQADSITICRLSDTTAVIGYAYGATHRVRVLSVSGTTLTAEAITNMTDTGVDFLACELLDTNKVFYAYSDSSSDGYARILTISGVAITENAAHNFDATGGTLAKAVGIIDTSTAALAWIITGGSSGGSVTIFSVSGTTISFEDDAAIAAVAGTSSTDQSTVDISMSLSDSTYMYALMRTAGDEINKGRLVYSGGTLTRESGVIWASPENFNMCTIATYKHTDGADPGYDYHISAMNDTDNDWFQIAENDEWFGGKQEDTSINTTNAVTADGQLRLFPGTTTGILIWNASTEAITITAPSPALSLAPMTKPADIDSAGEFIYLALLEGGAPIITKISTDLLSDGSTVFSPGSGDNIGVECGRFNSDVVWVAGQFDGTNVVEYSDDGGATFSVVDDGTIGGIKSFVMGPDSDNRLLVFDEDNGDILETRDGGASWKTINASVTPEIAAIARLGQNVEESVFGNDGAASNSVNYSVNSGDDLEDYQTGVYPNANATRVIVN